MSQNCFLSVLLHIESFDSRAHYTLPCISYLSPLPHLDPKLLEEIAYFSILSCLSSNLASSLLHLVGSQ